MSIDEEGNNNKDEEEVIEDLKPLKVEIMEKEKEKEHPEWEEVIDALTYIPTDKEIKEMTDAQ